MKKNIIMFIAAITLNAWAAEPKSIDLSYEQVLNETAYAVSYLTGKKCLDVKTKIQKNIILFASHESTTNIAITDVLATRSTQDVYAINLATWLATYSTGFAPTNDRDLRKKQHLINMTKTDALRAHLYRILTGKSKLSGGCKNTVQ